MAPTRRIVAVLSHVPVNAGQVQPRCDSSSTAIGGNWPYLAKVWPELAQLGQTIAQSGQNSPNWANSRLPRTCWTTTLGDFGVTSELAGIAGGNFPGRAASNLSANFGYIGSLCYDRPLPGGRLRKTCNGKNIGNQLNMPSDNVLGWIDIRTSPYKVQSK